MIIIYYFIIGNRQNYYNATSSSSSQAIKCDGSSKYNCQGCTLDSKSPLVLTLYSQLHLEKCMFTIPYAGIEEVANMYQDTVNVGSVNVPVAVFGSITDIKQNLRKRMK